MSKTADKVFEMLDAIVERIGEENVVQVVTDNAANYKAAGQLLMEKRKSLFWTPCAAHCIDLILEDFEKKLKVHQKGWCLMQMKGAKLTYNLNHSRMQNGCLALTLPRQQEIKKTSAQWWDSYGDECPELQRFAIRVLSLTCTSSGCERNWSAFEMVHTKRRNRLHQKKMNDLVFVMCNLKLNDNQVKKQAGDFGIEDDLSSDDDWITEGEKHPNFDLLGAIDSATRRQNSDEDESDEEEIPNDVEMESHGIEDDLDIQIDDIGVVSDWYILQVMPKFLSPIRYG
eukprot:XP_024446160.1 uncharacterized protein LOC18107638 [Populus trichocarpa]